MKRILAYLRKETIVGKHLHTCMADAALRAAGWKRMQDAKRIARRLDINPRLIAQ